MPHRFSLTPCLMVMVLLFGKAHADDRHPVGNQCRQCHAAEQTGFNVVHAFAAQSCTACHAGDAASAVKEVAHKGLIAFPGDLASARRACGGCHANRVSGVVNSLMHSGRGIVHVTRSLLEDTPRGGEKTSLQSLGNSVADSMLRKQCASCHLGQPKTKHALDVTRDRGGGCLACHINSYPDEAHPALTASVDDGRCFGCHSRSGRISLSYTGLAETDPAAESAISSALRLADGRFVERLPADAHYLAGMSCIDCHTSVGLMGDAGIARHQRQAVDIDCADCHDNNNARIALSDWPAELTSMTKHVPFDTSARTRFLTTRVHGTPLWHIELTDDGAWLHTKNTGRKLRVPPLDPARCGRDQQHERVSCAACHSQWAPQCFGCHMTYDPGAEQWDHVDRKLTAGHWSDKRWHVDNALPALGINESNEIEPFVPGMIMSVAHPSLPEARFVRQFAPLSPHTTGASRSCASCHRSSDALGLGQGELINNDEGLFFIPAHALLRDGLPADAWTNIDNSRGGQAPFPGQRPFNSAEIKSVLDADIGPGLPGTN